MPKGQSLVPWASFVLPHSLKRYHLALALLRRVRRLRFRFCRGRFREAADLLSSTSLHKLKFSPPIQAEIAIERKINPKRMQREIQSQLQDKGIGTKAQQALKLQHEQCKLERKTKSREQKETEKDRQFAIRQEKKKAKHRGR